MATVSEAAGEGVGQRVAREPNDDAPGQSGAARGGQGIIQEGMDGESHPS
jgi:hypothetical protein